MRKTERWIDGSDFGMKFSYAVSVWLNRGKCIISSLLADVGFHSQLDLKKVDHSRLRLHNKTRKKEGGKKRRGRKTTNKTRGTKLKN